MVCFNNLFDVKRFLHHRLQRVQRVVTQVNTIDTTNLRPKYSFKSPITKRSCHNGHPKECKTRAKDSQDSDADYEKSPVSLSKLAEALPLQALMPRNMLEAMLGQDDMK